MFSSPNTPTLILTGSFWSLINYSSIKNSHTFVVPYCPFSLIYPFYRLLWRDFSQEPGQPLGPQAQDNYLGLQIVPFYKMREYGQFLAI